MLNGAKLAKAQGFSTVIFTEGDNVFDERDLLYMVSRVKGSIREGKKALFFRGHPEGVNALSVLVCAFEADFFLEKFEHVKSKADWLQLAESNGGNVTVEKVMTHCLESSEDVKVLQVDSPTDDRLAQHFPNSQTNVITASFEEEKDLPPISSICTEWSPSFNSQRLFWITTRSLHVKSVVAEVFTEDGALYKEEFRLDADVTLRPLSFSTDHSSFFFRNTWHLTDGTSETREFSLSANSLKKYLQLNTVQFGFK
jgi:hypothetical protein